MCFILADFGGLYVTLSRFHRISVHASNLSVQMQIYFPLPATSITASGSLGDSKPAGTLCSQMRSQFVVIDFFLHT